jgi:transposase-like protein
VVSDDNEGLRKALMKYYQGVTHQPCQMHFMRNFMSKFARKDRPESIQFLQELFMDFSWALVNTWRHLN